jgi:pSer/pThr/pTyr-binding forkhead associated (FHA) protein
MDKTVYLNTELKDKLSKLKKNGKSYLMLNQQQIPLVSKITLGRDSKNSIVVADKMVSKFHAVIQKIKDDYYLKDLGSTNGTFVNSERAPENKYIKLQENDSIRVGRTDLSFMIRFD